MINYYRTMGPLLTNFALNPPPKITVPLRLLWGKQDPYLSEALATDSVEQCEHAEIVWAEENGHWLHWGNPNFVNTHIAEFFRE
jgi:pimeloyl-ACP methyl ester carboxylesterase